MDRPTSDIDFEWPSHPLLQWIEVLEARIEKARDAFRDRPQYTSVDDKIDKCLAALRGED